jgi:nicotinamidase-related amidase
MNTTTATRPVTTARMPSFFNPDNAAKWDYRPAQASVFDEAVAWRGQAGLRPSASDRKKLRLLLIDAQKDFCFPEGTLYVGGRSGTGAIDDSRRTAEFIYRNLPLITSISPTLDTHIPFQIFSRSFWENEDGSPVSANTIITSSDVEKGTCRPSLTAAGVLGVSPIWLTSEVLNYCRELEKGGKYQLFIWPEHCLLGSAGHNLVGVIEEAALFHAIARGSQTDFQIKGGNPLTENYSVLRPEVLMRHDGKPSGQKNVRFIEALLNDDYVVIAGQAASHCVKSSIDDLLSEIVAKDPKLAQKVYVMQDCMSSVVIPDGQGGVIADFTPQAEDAFTRFSNAGMHLVDSTTPIDQWPDLVL